jgi:ribosomal protein S18 acetylase RimI-like enzyme
LPRRKPVQNDSDCADYFLSEEKFDLLADFLGDSPETVICVHSLRRRVCRAFVKGDTVRPQAAIVQLDCTPSEPSAYGNDTDSIYEVLKHIEAWDAVNVDEAIAQSLARIMESDTPGPVGVLGDVYYALNRPSADFRHHDVRELVPDDIALLDSAPPELRGCGFKTSLDLLKEGVVACGVISGRVVAIGHTSAISGGYADIGVHTASDWRCRGFATACASMVASRVQAMGLIPVWSTSEDNPASIKIAEKLGFERVSRRAYLVPKM